jgi:uncharacterized protein YggU (UPF0235/DUF167 family)
MSQQKKGKWADMAVVGAEFTAHVTPRARRDAVEWHGGVFFVQTTTAPEDGRATAAVAQALALPLLLQAPVQISVVPGVLGWKTQQLLSAPPAEPSIST